jgi:hypothetical protein
MSIYATLWALQFPRFGEFHIDCEWVTVIAQGVPAHVGAEVPDPYSPFLPALPNSVAADLRAVVLSSRVRPKALSVPLRSIRRPCLCSQVCSMRQFHFPTCMLDSVTLSEATGLV